MKPHAIFISLTDNYTYLFNALYNSAEFFGVGEYADFVVIHSDLPESYINFMNEKTQDRKTKIRFVQFTPNATDAVFGKVMNIKYHRYRIMAEVGKEYKSILFLDTDIFLVFPREKYIH